MTRKLKAGQLVRSLAGRDKGRLFLVLKVEEPYVWVVDGKLRPLNHPKRKKWKHVIPMGKCDDGILARLPRLSDGELHKYLNAFQKDNREGSDVETGRYRSGGQGHRTAAQCDV